MSKNKPGQEWELADHVSSEPTTGARFPPYAGGAAWTWEEPRSGASVAGVSCHLAARGSLERREALQHPESS